VEFVIGKRGNPIKAEHLGKNTAKKQNPAPKPAPKKKPAPKPSLSIQDQKKDGKIQPLKVALVGGANVGKTTIIQAYHTGEFVKAHEPTVGAAFVSKQCSFTAPNGLEIPISMNIWDTAGQDRYYSMMPLYTKRSRAICFVFDLTRPATLENVLKRLAWIEESHPDLAMTLLVGNKRELDSARKLTQQQAGAAARHFDCYYELSATDIYAVQALFRDMRTRTLNKLWTLGNFQNSEHSVLNLGAAPACNTAENEGGCC
jgi:small GTP-binding protein